MSTQINQLFKNLINKPVRHIKLGHGSFLTIGFGPDISIDIVVRGKKEIKLRPAWYFWTYMCSWELDMNGTIVTSEDDREEIAGVLKLLQNKKLLTATVENDYYDMKLEFEDGTTLSLFSDNSEDDNVQWRLYTPDKKVLVAGPLTQLSYENSSSKSE